MTTPQLLCSSKEVHVSVKDNHGPTRLSLPDNNAFECDDLKYGLLITLQKNPECNDGGSFCEISLCRDENYVDIHPNAYAPAALTGMRKLGGGGSGVAVFEGQHPTLGDLVMKHGGDKDMKELFALATIAEELHERGKSNPKAAAYLQERIPEFRMIYISPQHLGEKRRELWHKLAHIYKYSSRNLLILPEDDEDEKEEEEEETKGPSKLIPETSAEDNLIRRSQKQLSPLQRRRQGALRRPHHQKPQNNGLKITQSGTVSGHRSISVYSNIATGSGKSAAVELLGDTLIVSVPSPTQDENLRDGVEYPFRIQGNGYEILKDLVNDLVKLQKEHKWKFTLGQKRIGGENPKTGNIWLYEGALHDTLLNNLISQKIQLVRDLATLTTDEEKDPKFLREMQMEMVKFEEEEDVTPADISVLTDSFVGNAIKKNFEKDVGRFAMLEYLGRQFRDYTADHRELELMSLSNHSHHGESRGSHLPLLRKDSTDLALLPEEEIASYHLGNLTRNGALMGDTFENVPHESGVLEMNPFYWRNLLRAAIQPRRQSMMGRTSEMALTRIWTCGLTDAGVHNLFLTEDAMWLFDLGQPQLFSAPGFLTKFLFSFFHTLGMEETSDDNWVRRFEHNDDTKKLRLTHETEILLEKAYTAFGITLDRLIDELFDRDDSLRWLLIQYVTLQLLSDASFCLQRWTIKGGGRTRDANHQKGIEKWLWRALWDLFVAYDLNTSETWTRLYVEHPSNRDSVFFSDMKDLLDDDFIATLRGIDEVESNMGHVRCS